VVHVSRSPDFDAKELENVKIKRLQKLCWNGKPVIKGLVEEAKLLFSACVKDSEPFTSFLEQLVKKFFNFLCNLEKVNLAGIKDARVCFDNKLNADCVVNFFPEPIKIANHGICE
jgi:hypothetical protein